ncbi:MAG: preprotein translocase subunit YajC [Dehalococcoidales bacterium]|jgi:preprotein translocase subunit YajC|nr:preprotein translocase subunit YajC [Dehalococcoidales bacterium]
MKRSKILGLALIVAVLATMALLGGCYPTSTEEGGSSTTSTIYMIVFLVLIFAMFYFLMIRPQRKRQKEHQKMMEELKRGDRIITAGGIFGVIESVSEDSVVIKVESGTTLRLAKGSVAVVREK